ncbi:MAG: hypothetical protein ACI845_001298 [Gammaproteobacteria bacterium]|jgi:hypothetical protein
MLLAHPGTVNLTYIMHFMRRNIPSAQREINGFVPPVSSVLLPLKSVNLTVPFVARAHGLLNLFDGFGQHGQARNFPTGVESVTFIRGKR